MDDSLHQIFIQKYTTGWWEQNQIGKKKIFLVYNDWWILVQELILYTPLEMYNPTTYRAGNVEIALGHL